MRPHDLGPEDPPNHNRVNMEAHALGRYNTHFMSEMQSQNIDHLFLDNILTKT